MNKASATNSSPTPVQVLVGEYWLHGSINAQGRRVLDLLRDSHTSFVQLEHTALRPRNDPARTLSMFQSGYLPKEKVSLIVLPQGDEQDPLQKMFRLSGSRSFKGSVVLASCEIQGDVHGIPRLADNAGTYIPEIQTYFPVTNARLTSPGTPAIQAPTILINKTSVISFLEGESLLTPEDCLESLFGFQRSHSHEPKGNGNHNRQSP